MKRYLLGLSAALALIGGSASAQDPGTNEDNPTAAHAPNQTASLTPEIWLYLQEMKRYEDPRQVVRRNAEARANERRDRIATLKWYGISKSRPVMTPVPYMESYLPYRSRNVQPVIAIRIDAESSRR